MKASAMMHPDSTRRTVLGGFAGTLAVIRPAAASYPERVVRVVIAFPPGAPPDLFARMLAPALGQSLMQSFIVDNRPASGIVGTGAGATKMASEVKTWRTVVETNGVERQ